MAVAAKRQNRYVDTFCREIILGGECRLVDDDMVWVATKPISSRGSDGGNAVLEREIGDLGADDLDRMSIERTVGMSTIDIVFDVLQPSSCLRLTETYRC